MRLDNLGFVAWKFLWGKAGITRSNGQKSLWGSILGIAFAMVPLIVVLELADGMIDGIMSRYIELGSYHAQIGYYGDSEGIELQNRLEGLKNRGLIQGYWKETDGIGIAIKGKKKRGVSVRGLDSKLLLEPGFVRYLRSRDGKLELNGPGQAIIAKALAERLGLGIGERVQLMTVSTSPNGALLPRLNSFRIAGIADSGYQELDGDWFLISREKAEDVFKASGAIRFIGLKLPKPPGLSYEEIAINATNLGIELGFEYHLDSWQDCLEAQYQSLKVTKFLLILIAGLIVLIAGLNVSSAILMLMHERSAEIAILVSMGEPRVSLMAIFAMVGLFIGSASVILGMPLGILLSINLNSIVEYGDVIARAISSLWFYACGRDGLSFSLLSPEYYLDEVPITIRTGELVVIAVYTMAMASLAAFLPLVKKGNWKAAELLKRK